MGLENIQNYIIGIILFILVITGGMYFIGSLYSTDASLDTRGDIAQFNKTLQLSANVTQSVNKLNSTLKQATDPDSSFLGLGWINALVGSAFNGLQAVGDSLSFIFISGAEISGYFGIPSFVFPLIVLIVVVIIVFAIWNVIFKV